MLLHYKMRYKTRRTGPDPVPRRSRRFFRFSYIFKYRFLLPFFLCALLLSGCGSGASPGAKTGGEADDDSITAFAPAVLVPTADGRETIGNDSVTVDISNTAKGYIMASYHGSAPQVNIQLTGPDGVSYLYFISEKDTYTAMPLSSGDGSYIVEIYEQMNGDMYSLLLSDVIEVTLENEFTPFLYSNQFVYFTEDTRAVQKGRELAQGCASDLDITTAIYHFVINNTEYDYDKAATVTSPYYPDVDETMDTGKGICFDYSALMCTMLRTQGIPCKLNIGYAGDVYHAWISVYLKSVGWVDSLIQFDGKNWSMMDPTMASTSKDSYDPSKEEYTVMFQR